jgi:hypothetical protein
MPTPKLRLMLMVPKSKLLKLKHLKCKQLKRALMRVLTSQLRRRRKRNLASDARTHIYFSWRF